MSGIALELQVTENDGYLHATVVIKFNEQEKDRWLLGTINAQIRTQSPDSYKLWQKLMGDYIESVATELATSHGLQSPRRFNLNEQN